MMLVLLAVIIISALPYSLLALCLLSIIFVTAIRPMPPRFIVVVTVATIFLTPLVLAPLLNSLVLLPPTAVHIIAVALTLPAVYLLDHSLRQNTYYQPRFMKARTGRHITQALASLFISTLVIMMLSLLTGNPALLFTSIIFLLYLMGALTGVLFTIPKQPLTTPTTMKRIIAGITGSMPLQITNLAQVKMPSHLNPAVPWFKATPQSCILNRGKTKLEISFTPPLAGQFYPQLQISALDPRGFIQTDQVLEPLQLHIIPRARYAEWLAQKYLEQMGAGVISASTLPPQAAMVTKRGVEYMDSRTYQPGDQLKDIDWKHTLKLSQLIVREYSEAGEQAAIIAVNLSVADAEEADKLAFNLITVALTLARENIPSALAAYNHQRVINNIAITDPITILRHALELVKEISLVQFSERHLEPSDIAKIRRNITQLKRAKSEPSQRLLDVLNFEYRAIEEAAKNHPATITLSAAVKQAPSPAMIFLISQLNHDAEAILVTAEKLSRRKFTTVPVYTTN